jgi:replicative DNA helicase
MYNSATEIELVGVVLAHPQHFGRAAFIAPSEFNDHALGRLWEIFGSMREAGINISASTLSLHYGDEITAMGGDAFLGGLAARGATVTTEVERVIERFAEHSLWVRLGGLTARLASAVEKKEKAPGEVISGLLDYAAKLLATSGDTTQSKSEVVQRMIESAQKPREITTSGIDTLDYLMQGGLREERLYGIGGIFGRGKTIFLGSISENVNMQGVPHLFITMETPPEDIEARHCARHMNINASSLLDPTDEDFATFQRHAQKYTTSAANNVRYDYAPGASMGDIHRKILAAKARYGCKGVIIDYWQLISGRERGQSQEQHLASVANRLAAIARQEKIWIVMAAQIDERGKLIDSQALLRAASLYLRIDREENGQAINLITEKSNYTRYADTSHESTASVIFDQEKGPYVRNVEPTDMPGLAEDDNIKV